MSARSLWLLPCLVACDPLEPCQRTALVEEPLLELRIGNPIGFDHPTKDGERVVPVSGSQGGRHVWLSVHTAGLWPGDHRALGDDRDVPRFRAVLADAATGEVLTEQSWGWFAMEGDELDATLALEELYLPDPSGYGSTDGYEYGEVGIVGDQPVRLEVDAEDVCGTALQADLDLILGW